MKMSWPALLVRRRARGKDVKDEVLRANTTRSSDHTFLFRESGLVGGRH
jgi:hypothetical protein